LWHHGEINVIFHCVKYRLLSCTGSI
jgi:hypothetical protein